MRLLHWACGQIALRCAPRRTIPTKAVLDLLSIRARVALGCVCLESVCREWGLLSGKMPELLNALWDFTSSTRLDAWDGRITALVPDDAASVPGFVDQETLDPNRTATLFEMMQSVHSIGGENLFGAYASHYTREPTERVLSLFAQTGCSIPDMSRFARSTVLEAGGWGTPRPAEFFRDPTV